MPHSMGTSAPVALGPGPPHTLLLPWDSARRPPSPIAPEKALARVRPMAPSRQKEQAVP